MSAERAVVTILVLGGVATVGVLWLVAWITGVTQREINEFTGEKK